MQTLLDPCLDPGLPNHPRWALSAINPSETETATLTKILPPSNLYEHCSFPFSYLCSSDFLVQIAERYDREKLGPISPGLAGFTRGVKDRETAPHFNGKDATSRFNAKDREAETAAPRIGAVPNRRAEGGREPRKKGDEVSDWRKSKLGFSD